MEGLIENPSFANLFSVLEKSPGFYRFAFYSDYLESVKMNVTIVDSWSENSEKIITFDKQPLAGFLSEDGNSFTAIKAGGALETRSLNQ